MLGDCYNPVPDTKSLGHMQCDIVTSGFPTNSSIGRCVCYVVELLFFKATGIFCVSFKQMPLSSMSQL